MIVTLYLAYYPQVDDEESQDNEAITPSLLVGLLFIALTSIIGVPSNVLNSNCGVEVLVPNDVQALLLAPVLLEAVVLYSYLASKGGLEVPDIPRLDGESQAKVVNVLVEK